MVKNPILPLIISSKTKPRSFLLRDTTFITRFSFLIFFSASNTFLAFNFLASSSSHSSFLIFFTVAFFEWSDRTDRTILGDVKNCLAWSIDCLSLHWLTTDWPSPNGLAHLRSKLWSNLARGLRRAGSLFRRSFKSVVVIFPNSSAFRLVWVPSYLTSEEILSISVGKSSALSRVYLLPEFFPMHDLCYAAYPMPVAYMMQAAIRYLTFGNIARQFISGTVASYDRLVELFFER